MSVRRFASPSTLLLVIAVGLAFLPLILVAIWDVWPPAAMVQETFSVNFSTYSLMRHRSEPFEPVHVGQFQILLLSYPANAVVASVRRHLPMFSQFTAFALLFYAWAGLLLTVIFWRIRQSSLSLVEQSLLVLVPFAPFFLERGFRLSAGPPGSRARLVRRGRRRPQAGGSPASGARLRPGRWVGRERVHGVDRSSQSTMIDLPLFTVFSATVCTSALLATGIVGGRVGAAVVAALIVAYASPFALYEFGAVFRRLESNSGVARRINTVLERGRPLPIVYYLATGPAGLDWRHQPLIFPDPAMIMPVGLPISRPKSWMAEYFPRARFTHPALGLDPQAHMAVIPEAVDIPDNGVARVDVFGTFSSFARSVSDRSEECRVFQFEELQDRRQLMHFFSYRTRVTVCLMRPAAA